jgi:hypothetical protein
VSTPGDGTSASRPGFFMGVAGEGPELQPCYFDHGLPVRG